MQSQLFNDGWKFRRGVAGPFDNVYGGAQSDGEEVMLPHDAMIGEERDPNCASANQSGYYPAYSYTYTKQFFAPKEWREQSPVLEFEGVMQKAMVYVNGNFAASHAYGYSQFYVPLADVLRYGETNVIKVIASCEEKSSRWYSGAGIYRNVVLWLGGAVCIPPEGVRIVTEAIEDGYAVLGITAELRSSAVGENTVKLRCQIDDPEGKAVAIGENVVTLRGCETRKTHLRVAVNEPSLWSAESPSLYTLRIKVECGDKVFDTARERFGIRSLRLDARQGLRVNGKTVKLRGACIHHDNGIIGARTFYDAEAFRIRKLKEAGFNAVRSAHDPMSKEMLRACDELGMYVMDELADMWNEPKNCNDFSFSFASSWKEELANMVKKDVNHPCVILYGLGNEIPEIGRSDGKRLNREMANELRSLDPTRYVTNSVNGYLAVADQIARFADGGAEQYREADDAKGSEQLNEMMGNSQQQLLDQFAVSPILTEALEESSCELDVVGLNYLTARHELEHALNPDRVVLGTETYPPEIPRLWAIVERNAHVIGDFSWTGYDYIGEAGIGIYHYNADRSDQGWYPDRLAYTGDFDLNAYRRPVSYLREIAYGLRKQPYMAVYRPEHEGQRVDQNNWKYADAIASWTFPGFEGKKMRVLVLSPSEEVELFLNGASLGRKRTGQTAPFTAEFEVEYAPGELKAVCCQKGNASGEFALCTAGEPAQIRVEASKQELTADGQSLVFLVAELADENGVVDRNAKRKISVCVKGEGSLLGLGSADPSSEGNYFDCAWETYDGRVMAAVRSGTKAGKCQVTFSAEGLPDKTVELNVLPVR